MATDSMGGREWNGSVVDHSMRDGRDAIESFDGWWLAFDEAETNSVKFVSASSGAQILCEMQDNTWTITFTGTQEEGRLWESNYLRTATDACGMAEAVVIASEAERERMRRLFLPEMLWPEVRR